MKNKRLHRTASALLERAQALHRDWERNNIQFQSQDPETRQAFYSAIDNLKTFCDNIS